MNRHEITTKCCQYNPMSVRKVKCICQAFICELLHVFTQSICTHSPRAAFVISAAPLCVQVHNSTYIAHVA